MKSLYLMTLSILATICISAHLLLLLWQSSSLNIYLPQTQTQQIWIQLVLLGVVALMGFFKNRKAKAPPSKTNLLIYYLIAAFSTLLLGSTILNHASGINIREASLACITIYVMTQVCPQLLSKNLYRFVFTLFLFFFCAHSMVLLAMAIKDTNHILGHYISCHTGRPFQYFGPAGALVPGIFSNPNTLGCYLLFLPSLALVISEKLKQPWLRMGTKSMALILVAHIAALLSRACLITTVMTWGAWISLAPFKNKQKRLLGSIFLALALLSLLYIAANSTTDPPAFMRTLIWADYWQAIAKQPWGYGWEGLQLRGESPHNFILAVATYAGIPGALAFLTLLILLLRKAYINTSTQAEKLLFYTVVMVVLIHGSVEFVIGHPLVFMNSLFWLILGYLLQNDSLTADQQPLQANVYSPQQKIST